MGGYNSEITGFYKLPINKRRELLSKLIKFNENDIKLLENLEQEYESVSADSDEIADIIQIQYDKWKKGKLLYGCNEEKLKVYERKNQAKLYSQAIKECFEKS